MKKLFTLLLLPVFFGMTTSSASEFRDGDLIFQTSRSAQSAAIQEATHSKYSHVGMILHRRGRPYVFEAVKTVQYTPLTTWIARGDGGRYVVMRLREAERILSEGALARLRGEAAHFQGKPYDLTFEWSDDRIYCSELVWKIYERAVGVRIGNPQKLRDFDLSSPMVKRKMKERYGNRIPLDETVVSPGEMFVFDGLVLVEEK